MSDLSDTDLTAEALLRRLISQLQEAAIEHEAADFLHDDAEVREARKVPHVPPDPGGLKSAAAAFEQRVENVWCMSQSEAAELDEFQAVQQAASADPAAAILFLLSRSAEYIERFDASAYEDCASSSQGLPMLLVPLVRRKQKFSAEQFDVMLGLLHFIAPCQTNTFPWSHFAKQIETYAAAREPSTAQWNAIGKIAADIACRGSDQIRVRLEKLLTSRLEKLALDGDTTALPPLEFKTREPWVERLRTEVIAACGPPPEIDKDLWWNWKRLIDHAATATASKPSKKWLKLMRECVDAIGCEQVAKLLAHVLADVGLPAPVAPVRVFQDYAYSQALDATVPHETHSDLLRGLCWLVGVCPNDGLIHAVGRCGEVCYTKIRNHGPRAPKVGNACVAGLCESGSPLAVARLSRMHETVRHASSKKQIGKALDRAAEAAGLTREDLEEAAVPDCGFTSVGRLEMRLGDFLAVVSVNRRFKTELSWTKPDGKPQKSVPKEVKDSHADRLKELRSAVKVADQVLATWRSRIENFRLARREHPASAFTERLAAHPLLGVIARRLIWSVTDAAGGEIVGLASEQGFVDVSGTAHSPAADATVRLWHPIDADAQQVLSWRERLASEEITQPFKQAHREVYLLTDAERTTSTYSNRFASHIIKQHQLKALCDARDWRYTIQGNWDGEGGIPTRHLPAWDMRAEYWIEGAGSETGETGTWLYMSTDQVRFYASGSDTPMPLEEVPPIVFCEIMRDIDLFVGVAGIGSDPTWQDGGQEAFRGYWHDASFGELSQTAETRRDVLRMLIPRLKIADCCEVEDRFLIVRGDKRTYKIHLGSGNILMEPNNQYLCIVSDRSSKADQVVLPFEGDRTLSLILSKAFLLADDNKITDPTILSQIDA